MHLPTGASCHGDLSPLHAHPEPAEPLSGKAAQMKEGWSGSSLVYQSFGLVLANEICGIVYICVLFHCFAYLNI